MRIINPIKAYSIIVLLLFFCAKIDAQEIRELPLRSTDVPASSSIDTIRVKNIIELKKALKNYKNNTLANWTVISLKKGTYHILESPKKYLSLKDAEHLIIDFQGSEIIFNTPAGLLSLNNCKQVIVKNVVIDFDPLPFTQGYVLNVNHKQKSITVKLKEGWPTLNNSSYRNMGKNWALIKDPKTPGKQKRDCLNVYTLFNDWSELEKGVFKVNFKSPIKNIEVGDKYVHLGPGGGNCFSIHNSYQTTFENIHQYAGGVFMEAQKSDAVNIIDCEVKIKSDTDRWHSITRDIFIERNSRIGPWVEGCFFEGNGDDGINLHTKGFKIVERKSDYTLVVDSQINQFKTRSEIYLHQNDSISIFDNNLGKHHFKGLIKSVTAKLDGTYLLKFDQKLPEFHDISMKLKGIDARYEGWNISTNCPNFLIKDNTFKYQRRFGLLTLSKNGLIKNNKFIGSSANAIYLGFLEEASDIGLVAGNILIENNVFDDCYLQNKTKTIKLQPSVINVTLPKRPDGLDSPFSFFSNIKIKNNQFINHQGDFPLINISNTEQAEITKNTFYNYTKTIKHPISIATSTKKIIKNNHFSNSSLCKF